MPISNALNKIGLKNGGGIPLKNGGEVPLKNGGKIGFLNACLLTRTLQPLYRGPLTTIDH